MWIKCYLQYINVYKNVYSFRSRGSKIFPVKLKRGGGEDKCLQN